MKRYDPFAIGLAAALGVISGIVAASFGFKLLKPPKGAL
jgi:hypothetical protein